MGSRRWQLPIAFVLVALGAVSIGFYLNHFLAERDFLVDQNRRIVRNLSQQVAGQLDGLASVLQTAAWELYRHNPPSFANEEEAKEEGFVPGPKARKSRRARLAAAIDRSPYLDFVDLREVDPVDVAIPQEKPDLKPLLSTTNGRVQLRMGPLPWKCDRGSPCGLEMVVDVRLDVLLRSLRHARLFEEVLLADADGRVLYTVYERHGGDEDGSEHDPFQHLDGLLTAASEPAISSHAASVLTSAPHRLRASVSGGDYWVILEPVPFAKLAAPDGDGGGAGAAVQPFWALAALVPVDEFIDASRSVPLTVVLLPTLGGLLALLLLYPWIKLWNCGAFEPYARIELSLAGFAFAAFVGLLAATWYDYRALDERQMELESRLTKLAEDVGAAFEDEVRAIVRQLFQSLPSLAADYRTSSDRVCDPEGEEDDDTAPASAPDTDDEPVGTRGVICRSRVLGDADLRFDDYPYFDQLVWMDEKGRQRVKWAARDTPTTPGKYADRPYFSRPVAGTLWRIDVDLGGETRNEVGYYIQSIQSRTTGERKAVVAVVVEEDDVPSLEPGKRAPAEAIRSGTVTSAPVHPNVVTLTTPLWSLDRPIIPGDIDFVVLGPNREILFYSDADARFFETLDRLIDEDADLASAVDDTDLGADGRTFELSYRDHERHVHVRPVSATGWKLVVVASNDGREALNVELLRRVGAGFLVYGLGVLAIALAIAAVVQWLLRISLRSDTWLWAGPRRVPAYAQLALALAATSTALLAARPSETPGATLPATPDETATPPLIPEWFPLELILWAVAVLLVVTAALAFRSPRVGPARRRAPPARADRVRVALLTVLLAGLGLQGWAPVATWTAALGVLLCGRFHEEAVARAERSLGLRATAFVAFGLALAFAIGAVPVTLLFREAASEVLPRAQRGAEQEFAHEMQRWLARNPAEEPASPEQEPTAAEKMTPRQRLESLCDGNDLVPPSWPVYLHGIALACQAPHGEGVTTPELTELLPLGSQGWLSLRPEPLRTTFSPTPMEWHHAAVLAVLGFCIWGVARRGLGLSSEWDLDVSDKISLSDKGSWLHVGPSGDLQLIDRAEGDGGVRDPEPIDLSDPTVFDRPLPDAACDYVVVERLEAVLGSRKLRPKALELISRLLEGGRKVHVVCEIDPLRWLSDPNQRGQEDLRDDLVQWATLFSGLRVRHYEPPPRPGEAPGLTGRRIQHECGVSRRLDKLADSLDAAGVNDPHDIEDMVLRRARAEFVRLWELCTDRERALLYLLAHGNVASYPNRQTAAELLRRGLIVRDGGYWIASGAFRRFVVSTVSPEDEARWSRLAGAAGWHLWRNVLLVLMVLAVGFVFVTQRDLFVSLGAFLAVLGSLPFIARMVGGFSSRNAGPAG